MYTRQTREHLSSMCGNEIMRNESIYKRRWKMNESWLKQYEDAFKEEYKDQNPFFKEYKQRTLLVLKAGCGI